MAADSTRDTPLTPTRGMNVMAVAGRRIDAQGSPHVRFPLGNAPQVRRALQDLFLQVNAQAVVCSAACGADLLALDVAEELALHVEVVLPFSAERFRATSVTDRPGDWGPLFDRLVNAAQSRAGLLIAEFGSTDHEGYRQVTELILQRAIELSTHTLAGAIASDSGVVTAVAIWEGAARGPDDPTLHFAVTAQRLGIVVRQILTRIDTDNAGKNNLSDERPQANS